MIWLFLFLLYGIKGREDRKQCGGKGKKDRGKEMKGKGKEVGGHCWQIRSERSGKNLKGEGGDLLGGVGYNNVDRLIDWLNWFIPPYVFCGVHPVGLHAGCYHKHRYLICNSEKKKKSPWGNIKQKTYYTSPPSPPPGRAPEGRFYSFLPPFFWPPSRRNENNEHQSSLPFYLDSERERQKERRISKSAKKYDQLGK